MNTLEVSGVGFAYGARQALNDLAFELVPGRFGALLGPNGAGDRKSVVRERVYSKV